MQGNQIFFFFSLIKELENFVSAKFENYNPERASQKPLRTVSSSFQRFNAIIATEMKQKQYKILHCISVTERNLGLKLTHEMTRCPLQSLSSNWC